MLLYLKSYYKTTKIAGRTESVKHKTPETKYNTYTKHKIHVLNKYRFSLQDYPISMDYTPPLPSLPNATIVSTGGGTLRRGIMRGIIGVPPPDVTHHTTPPPQHPQTSLLHDFNPAPTLSGLGIGIGVGIPISTNLSNLSQMSPQQTSTPISSNAGTMTIPKQPQSILKDPNRPKQASSGPGLTQNSGIGLVTSMGVIPGTILSNNPINGGINNGNMQILNVSPGLLTTATAINGSIMSCGGALYDPNTSSIHSLQTFSPVGSLANNSSSNNIGFTDSDGHLV